MPPRTTASPHQAANRLAPLRGKVQTLRAQVAGLTEDGDWRDWLEQLVSKRSLREMTEGELQQVVRALHEAGAPRTVPAGRLPYTDTPQVRKLRALWTAAHEAGVVREPSAKALAAFVKRITRQDIGALDLGAASNVIEAIKAMGRRAGVDLT